MKHNTCKKALAGILCTALVIQSLPSLPAFRQPAMSAAAFSMQSIQTRIFEYDFDTFKALYDTRTDKWYDTKGTPLASETETIQHILNPFFGNEGYSDEDIYAMLIDTENDRLYTEKSDGTIGDLPEEQASILQKNFTVITEQIYAFTPEYKAQYYDKAQQKNISVPAPASFPLTYKWKIAEHTENGEKKMVLACDIRFGNLLYGTYEVYDGEAVFQKAPDAEAVDAAPYTNAGDATVDGRQDVSDAVLTSRVSAEDSDAPISDLGLELADKNEDGIVSVRDVNGILYDIVHTPAAKRTDDLPENSLEAKIRCLNDDTETMAKRLGYESYRDFCEKEIEMRNSNAGAWEHVTKGEDYDTWYFVTETPYPCHAWKNTQAALDETGMLHFTVHAYHNPVSAESGSIYMQIEVTVPHGELPDSTAGMWHFSYTETPLVSTQPPLWIQQTKLPENAIPLLNIYQRNLISGYRESELERVFDCKDTETFYQKYQQADGTASAFKISSGTRGKAADLVWYVPNTSAAGVSWDKIVSGLQIDWQGVLTVHTDCLLYTAGAEAPQTAQSDRFLWVHIELAEDAPEITGVNWEFANQKSSAAMERIEEAKYITKTAAPEGTIPLLSMKRCDLSPDYSESELKKVFGCDDLDLFLEKHTLGDGTASAFHITEGKNSKTVDLLWDGSKKAEGFYKAVISAMQLDENGTLTVHADLDSPLPHSENPRKRMWLRITLPADAPEIKALAWDFTQQNTTILNIPETQYIYSAKLPANKIPVFSMTEERFQPSGLLDPDVDTDGILAARGYNTSYQKLLQGRTGANVVAYKKQEGTVYDNWSFLLIAAPGWYGWDSITLDSMVLHPDGWIFLTTKEVCPYREKNEVEAKQVRMVEYHLCVPHDSLPDLPYIQWNRSITDALDDTQVIRSIANEAEQPDSYTMQYALSVTKLYLQNRKIEPENITLSKLLGVYDAESAELTAEILLVYQNDEPIGMLKVSEADSEFHSSYSAIPEELKDTASDANTYTFLASGDALYLYDGTETTALSAEQPELSVNSSLNHSMWFTSLAPVYKLDGTTLEQEQTEIIQYAFEKLKDYLETDDLQAAKIMLSPVLPIYDAKTGVKSVVSDIIVYQDEEPIGIMPVSKQDDREQPVYAGYTRLPDTAVKALQKLTPYMECALISANEALYLYEGRTAYALSRDLPAFHPEKWLAKKIPFTVIGAVYHPDGSSTEAMTNGFMADVRTDHEARYQDAVRVPEDVRTELGDSYGKFVIRQFTVPKQTDDETIKQLLDEGKSVIALYTVNPEGGTEYSILHASLSKGFLHTVLVEFKPEMSDAAITYTRILLIASEKKMLETNMLDIDVQPNSPYSDYYDRKRGQKQVQIEVPYDNDIYAGLQIHSISCGDQLAQLYPEGTENYDFRLFREPEDTDSPVLKEILAQGKDILAVYVQDAPMNADGSAGLCVAEAAFTGDDHETLNLELVYNSYYKQLGLTACRRICFIADDCELPEITKLNVFEKRYFSNEETNYAETMQELQRDRIQMYFNYDCAYAEVTVLDNMDQNTAPADVIEELGTDFHTYVLRQYRAADADKVENEAIKELLLKGRDVTAVYFLRPNGGYDYGVNYAVYDNYFQFGLAEIQDQVAAEAICVHGILFATAPGELPDFDNKDCTADCTNFNNWDYDEETDTSFPIFDPEQDAEARRSFEECCHDIIIIQLPQ